MLRFIFGRSAAVPKCYIWAFAVSGDMSVFPSMKKEKTEAISDPEIIYKMLLY